MANACPCWELDLTSLADGFVLLLPASKQLPACAEETRPLVSAAPAQSDGGNWVPVLAPEDLPKGELLMTCADANLRKGRLAIAAFP